MRKNLSIVLVWISVFILFTPVKSSFAKDYMRVSYVSDKATVEKMLSLAKGHNLEGYVTYVKAKDIMEHVIYDSSFASFYQKKFYYPNKNKDYFYSIYDGTYTVNINGAKGCMAYSNYVESLIYGVHGAKKFHSEKPGKLTGTGIKEFLRKEAQIGEHLRVYDKHSMTYISSDENGFYFTNYTNDTKKTTELCYATFDEFARYYNCVKKSEYSSSVWLYNGNKNTNNLSELQTQQSSNVCPHTAYNDRGYCKKCKSEYKLKITTIANTGFTTVKDNTPVRKRPYSADKITKYLKKGTKVTVVGYAYNGYGNFWYKINDGTWIYSENLTESDSSTGLTINTLSHTGLSKKSVRLNAVCTYNGVRPTEVGLYLGTTPSSMDVYESESVNFSKNPFDIWYDLSGLKEGTTYYYRFYAKVNGREVAGAKKLFTTQGKSKDMATIEDPIAALGVIVDLETTTKITTTTARVNGGCSYTGTRPTEVGLKIGYAENALVKVASDVIDFSKNPFDIWYDLTGLKENTKYYFVFYAIVNGAEIISDTGTFTTAKGTTSQAVEALPQTNLNLTVNAVSKLTQTSARVNASCSYSGTRPSEVGLYIGTDSGNLKKHSSDVINFSKNPFDIWYDLTGLKAGTTYYYKVYAIVNGKTVWSELSSFTTAKGTTSAALNALTANTRTGIVTGTNGDNLAINDKAAASPKYSNEIGVIPPGAEMTVYPDKAVGNWYYVTYKGISGYAYGKYITFK